MSARAFVTSAVALQMFMSVGMLCFKASYLTVFIQAKRERAMAENELSGKALMQSTPLDEFRGVGNDEIINVLKMRTMLANDDVQRRPQDIAGARQRFRAEYFPTTLAPQLPQIGSQRAL